MAIFIRGGRGAGGAGAYDEAEINIGAATRATKREYLSKGGPPPNFSLSPVPPPLL